MPNHITNKVTFSAPTIYDEWICIKTITNDKGEFDFNEIIPMPDCLNIAPCCSDVDIVKYGKDTITGGIIPYEPKNVEKMRENIKETGYAYWYDFAVEKWGTKWNAYSNNIESGEKVTIDNDFIVKIDKMLNDGIPDAEEFALFANDKNLRTGDTFIFETAWSCPEPIFLKISELFPKITITIQYADEDIGYNCGVLIYRGGELVSKWNPEFGSKEAEQFSYDITGRIKEEEFDV